VDSYIARGADHQLGHLNSKLLFKMSVILINNSEKHVIHF